MTTLTQRRRENRRDAVCRLTLAGRTAQSIAYRLNITARTVVRDRVYLREHGRLG